MKKLLVLAILAGAAFLIYKKGFATSSAYKTYEKFADALNDDRWDDARSLAASDSVRAFIDEQENLPRVLGYERYKFLRGVVHMSPWRKVELEKTSPNGKKVTLRVIQELRRGPVTMAPIGKPTVRHTQDVILVETGDGWKVEEFSEEVEPLGDR